MGQKMRKYTLMLIGMMMALTMMAQKKAIQQIITNTATAVAGEVTYRMGADSILKDKNMTMAHAIFRYVLKSSDRDSREWQANFQNRIVYRMLVRQCQYFMDDYNEMIKNAQKHPEHLANCITAGSELLLQAYSFVKHAVVVAMNSKVPLPWKVDYDEFIEGKDNTPIYANDAERDKKDVDNYNLLLPSERYNILNNTLSQLISMRVALRAVNARLSTDFTWQRALQYAPNFRSYISEAQSRAFMSFGTNIMNRPLP